MEKFKLNVRKIKNKNDHNLLAEVYGKRIICDTYIVIAYFRVFLVVQIHTSLIYGAADINLLSNQHICNL